MEVLKPSGLTRPETQRLINASHAYCLIDHTPANASEYLEFCVNSESLATLPRNGSWRRENLVREKIVKGSARQMQAEDAASSKTTQKGIQAANKHLRAAHECHVAQKKLATFTFELPVVL
jgi:hypothetical protein